MSRINARVSRPVVDMRSRIGRFEGKTPEQALNEVGGLFCPEVQEIRTVTGIECKDYRAVINPNNGKCLGVVSDGWTPMDCKVVSDSISRLAETLKRVPKITNAFCVGDGRLVGLEAQIGDGTSIIEGDDVVPVMKVWQGNGGNAPLNFQFAINRLICTNGLRAPVAGLSAIFSCKHTKRIADRYDWNFDSILRNFASVEVDMLDAFRKFSLSKLDKAGAEAYFRKIAKARKDENEKADQTVASLFEVWNHPRQTMCGETVWRAFNAATEYLQYHGYRNEETMLMQNLSGKAADWKDQAFKFAVELAA
jgi:hypothetical protein